MNLNIHTGIPYKVDMNLNIHTGIPYKVGMNLNIHTGMFHCFITHLHIFN